MNKKKIKSYGYLSVGIERPVVKRIRAKLPKGTSFNTFVKFILFYHFEVFKEFSKLDIEKTHNLKYMPVSILEMKDIF